MKRLSPVLLLSASLAAGCAQLADSRMEARTRRMARAAYTTSPGACNGVVHSIDYAKGFEDGYYDVASGGEGCPPALPPKKYWRAAYQTPVGREHIEAYFQGFRDGAAAAKADGAAAYGTLYVSAEARNGLKRAAEQNNAGKKPLVPQPTNAPLVPLPPTPGMRPVEILGPGPLTPPNSTQIKPPMSDAKKAPPLRDLQQPPPPVPPPSAQRPEPKAPESKSPAPMASTMSSPADPLMPSPAAAVKQVEAVLPTPAPEPVKLKLPEFELPPGFAPEASLGDPKAVGDR